jgi:RHS repeat-associated protein
VSGTTTSYTYDGDDVRVQRTQGMTSTSFLWDRESGLPLLVDDGSFGYVYTHETPLDQIATGGTATSLLLDPLGSVRGVADGMGTLVGTRDYDVYGAVRTSMGTSSRLGFTGEQGDSETGFVFLRARYHDPATGRFLSRDTVQPNAPGSQGYHVYAYAANNPTTWTDPSGHIALAMTAMGGMTFDHRHPDRPDGQDHARRVDWPRRAGRRRRNRLLRGGRGLRWCAGVGSEHARFPVQ